MDFTKLGAVMRRISKKAGEGLDRLADTMFQAAREAGAISSLRNSEDVRERGVCALAEYDHQTHDEVYGRQK